MSRAAWQIHTEAARALAKPDDMVGSIVRNVLAFGAAVTLLYMLVQS